IANLVGPELPDVLAAIASLLSTIVFVQFWKPSDSADWMATLPSTQRKDSVVNDTLEPAIPVSVEMEGVATIVDEGKPSIFESIIAWFPWLAIVSQLWCPEHRMAWPPQRGLSYPIWQEICGHILFPTSCHGHLHSLRCHPMVCGPPRHWRQAQDHPPVPGGHLEAAALGHSDCHTHNGSRLSLQLLGYRLHNRPDPILRRQRFSLPLRIPRLDRLLPLRFRHLRQRPLREPPGRRRPPNRPVRTPYGRSQLKRRCLEQDDLAPESHHRRIHHWPGRQREQGLPEDLPALRPTHCVNGFSEYVRAVRHPRYYPAGRY
ncbi:hypothetical protein BC936DRAFT_142713, partial [Jimgerdemannia flammicorona]